jgi:hypothetical protein
MHSPVQYGIERRIDPGLLMAFRRVQGLNPAYFRPAACLWTVKGIQTSQVRPNNVFFLHSDMAGLAARYHLIIMICT